MGASLSIDGFYCKRSELEDHVSQAVSVDGYENGHSYGGGWASKGSTDLNFHSKLFVSKHEAADFIADINDKYNGLDVVRVVVHSDKRGYGTINKKLERIEKLQNLVDIEIPNAAAVRAINGKSKTRTCKACGNRHVLAEIRPYSLGWDSASKTMITKYRATCENHKCKHPFLFTKADVAKVDRLTAEIAALKAEVEAMAKKLPEDAPCFLWVVGGWCPS